MDHGLLDPLKGRSLDVGEADPAAGKSSGELEEIRVARRGVDDVVNQGQREAAPAAGQRNGDGVRCGVGREVAHDDMPEHALRVGASTLQVEAQGRQPKQDDSYPRTIALHPAEGREQGREREALALAVVGQQMGLIQEQQRAASIASFERLGERRKGSDQGFGRRAGLGLIRRLDHYLADPESARPQEASPPPDRLADAGKCVGPRQERVTEQNFGMEFLEESPEKPTSTMSFLSTFVETNAVDSDEVNIETALAENATTIKSTTAATGELKKLRDEQNGLNASLKAAADNRLADVATYARILAAERPLLQTLVEQLEAIPLAELPLAPDVEALAMSLGVDLAERPAAEFIAQFRSASDVLSKQLAEKQEATRVSLAAQVAPLTDVIERWRKKHEAWEAEISKRREQLKEAGLTLEVEHLERIRTRLTVIEGEVRKFTTQEETHKTARGERKTLVTDLDAVRVKRHQLREAISDQLVAAVNRGQSTLVSVKWRRSAQLDEYGSRLGQLFNLRSPRSERLAAAVDPLTLAGIGWRNDVAALAALRDGAEPFLADPTAAMDLLRKYDVLFELETFLVEDRPEIRVRFPGDPTGPGRLLGELSLGQVRSILLGFLLSSPGNAPLILDQPEDQLDGPFLADTVVGYLHAAKERRQVLVATHNPNVVVLGDAELVLPLRGESGHGEVVDQGSVDATATRAQVLRLLDGGPAAFEEHGRRYGYRVERMPS